MTFCIQYKKVPGNLFLRGQVARFEGISLEDAARFAARSTVERWWWE